MWGMTHIEYAIVCPPNFNPRQAIASYLRAEKLGKLVKVLAAGILLQLMGAGGLYLFYQWPLTAGALHKVAPAGPFVAFAGICLTLVAAAMLFRTLREDASSQYRYARRS